MKLFHVLFDKVHLNKTPKSGVIEKQMDTGYDEILEQIEYYRNKSIQDNTFYITGSSYLEGLIQMKLAPEIIRDVFLNRCIAIDNCEPKIPLELGNQLMSLCDNSNTFLGIHRSYAIQNDDPYEDPILKDIMQNGFINNGAAMQGIVNNNPPYPSQTLTPASDLMRLCGLLKHSYRGSRGALLVALPRDVVDLELDFRRGVDHSSLYHKDGYIYTFKPEYIVGYFQATDGVLKYYSKEELEKHYAKENRA